MGHLRWKYAARNALYFLCIVSMNAVLAQDVPQILNLSAKGELGREAQLSCSFLPENATAEWMFKGVPLKLGERIKQTNEQKALVEKDLDGNIKKFQVSNLTILNLTSTDAGDYLCVAKWGEAKAELAVQLDLSFPARLVKNTDGPIKLNATDQGNVTLLCAFEIYNASEVKWWKRGKDEITDIATQPAKQINIKKIESTLHFHIRRPEDNGTYYCQVWDNVSMRNITGAVDVIVYAAPKVLIDTVKAISSSQLFLNWTVHAYNLPIKGYNLMYRKLPSSDFNQYTREKISIKNTSFVLEGLDNSTEYQIKLEVTTSYGSSNPYVYPQIVKTLEKDPVFVPNISINGFSATSVTIGWAPPPEDIAEYIHYYLLEARKKDEGASKRAYHSRDNRNLPYMFDDLEPHSTYVFRVCSCSEFTRRCGNWSLEMEAVTLDGVPGAPGAVAAACLAEGRGRALELRWQPPVRPNAEIKGYSMELIGNSTYRDRLGNMKTDTWGPFAKHFSNETRSYRADDLQPNTNYTIRLSAMTRTRRRGEEQVRRCYTPPAAPDQPPRPRWKKIVENDRYMFKTMIPRMSERNGPICCYRVYLVRLPAGLPPLALPPPTALPLLSYEEAHANPDSGTAPLGAYVTDLFSNDKYPPDSELIMGDDGSFVDNKVCKICLKKPKRAFQPPTTTVRPTTTPQTTKEDDYDLLEEDSTIIPAPDSGEKRERRSYGANKGDNRFVPYLLLKDNGDYWSNPMMMDGPSPVSDGDEDLDIKDGPLDPESNYTLFVELIANVENEEPIYSEYLPALQAAAGAPPPGQLNVIEIVLQVTCGILALVLAALVAACGLHARRRRKLPPLRPGAHPLQAAFRYVVEEVLGGGRGAAQPPPELPPVAAEALPAAYAERQADSDYGFQKEFELLQMLPDCLPERTTIASEARENQSKNRYPDIKAYDQTRVKLTQIDGIVGSDYINANYVMGYKERKQFICAQGPTEGTVCDFWRMIWEHGLQLVVMLTNLEEYSKVKCSQYWPDERGQRDFGLCRVTHVREKRYSDYIVRELKVTKLPTNSEGQPIVENNGVAKRNGDCNSSAPTSPREKTSANGSETAATEERTVIQYHFLMWKDFAAPEHAHSILKFIKRVNEAAASLSGRPTVVHCSAGVGRTGTLVALDILLDQLAAEGQVAVFNTVRSLREQRNFLVQSLKQYVFVYRALVEHAYYGDTELPAARLKAAVDRLRSTPAGAATCLMERQFQKMLSSPVTEPVKSCSAGMQEENRCKNRSQDCLPYDRNRVILSPIPTREFSTYINASFIEAYDHSEGFIITQDPLPNTIADFWRMVAEHGVTTIVMLSEIGEGGSKCPRYWDDGEAAYEHLSVTYEDNESLPYYTRRQFTLVNTKNGSSQSVRQLQYHGWPTAPGHVPEVTRGLAELADAAGAAGPLLAHCSTGSERAPLFVALRVLVSALRAERRVDVLTAARAVRAQRPGAIDTFLQYEFLYRAILNYAELHNLMEDS